MKKLLFFACLMFALASCEKDPDMSELDTDLTVYTDYDSSADFGSYKTYFLPDSILEAGGHKATYWKDENAMKIIKAVESQMNERGYTRLTDPEDKDNADLGIQLSYVDESYQVVSGGYFGGWWDYGYWGPWWGGWYYPYTVSYTYSYATHSLMIEMADLQKKNDGETKNRLPIIWFGEAYGFRYGNNRYDMNLILDGIDQAFRQSDYLGKNK